jgi:hypothetical protein
VTSEHLLAGGRQPVSVLLQAHLDRPIVTKLLSAEARSVARASLLLLWRSCVLGKGKRGNGENECKSQDQIFHLFVLLKYKPGVIH